MSNVLKELNLQIKNDNGIRIRGIDFNFPNVSDQITFLYTMQRYFELNSNKNFVFNQNNQEFGRYLIFDSVFNLVGNFQYGQIEEYKKEIRRLKFESEKVFWGVDLGNNKLSINIGGNKQIELQYTPHSTIGATKVMIQPDGYAYDESFFVYVNTDHKADKELDVWYTFTNQNGRLTYKDIIKNNWIY